MKWRMKMLTLRICLAFILSAMLVGCGANSNPVKILQNHVEAELKPKLGDDYEIVDFEKVNGQKGVVFGQEKYKIDYKVTIKYAPKSKEPDTLYCQMECIYYFDNESKFNVNDKDEMYVDKCYKSVSMFIHPEVRQVYDGYVVGNLYGHRDVCLFKRVSKNDLVYYNGTKTLIMTDNGWMVE